MRPSHAVITSVAAMRQLQETKWSTWQKAVAMQKEAGCTAGDIVRQQF